ncbi:FkbM family methyltransferase [candidate division CSSED10-310 bacterium]|uniref:FkbM family methyltransferase n=1 Tax=candidate division CSSED10-310 bacterium TaxID=2855610 RepID=A0ABV6YVJ7_UNCC1
MNSFKTEFYRKLRRLLTIAENFRIFRLGKRLGISPDLYLQLNRPFITEAGIKTVIDIGAHRGKWSKTIHYLLPQAMIYCFEPIPSCFKLINEKMKNIRMCKTFNIALGEKSEIVDFYRHDFTAASSFLNLSPKLARAFPYTEKRDLITVKVERLDDILSDDTLSEEIFVKIDVQGFEDKAISGGKNTLSRAKFVLIELSYDQLYEGQPLFADVYNQLTKLGFSYSGNLSQLTHPVNDHVLQADALFLK